MIKSSVNYWLKLEISTKLVISGWTDISHKFFNNLAGLMYFFFLLFSAWFLKIPVPGKCKKILQGKGVIFFLNGGCVLRGLFLIVLIFECSNFKFSNFLALEIVFRYLRTLLKKNANWHCALLYAYQGKLQIDTDGQLSICRQRVSVKTCM